MAAVGYFAVDGKAAISTNGDVDLLGFVLGIRAIGHWQTNGQFLVPGECGRDHQKYEDDQEHIDKWDEVDFRFGRLLPAG